MISSLISQKIDSSHFEIPKVCYGNPYIANRSLKAKPFMTGRQVPFGTVYCEKRCFVKLSSESAINVRRCQYGRSPPLLCTVESIYRIRDCFVTVYSHFSIKFTSYCEMNQLDASFLPQFGMNHCQYFSLAQ